MYRLVMRSHDSVLSLFSSVGFTVYHSSSVTFGPLALALFFFCCNEITCVMDFIMTWQNKTQVLDDQSFFVLIDLVQNQAE